MTFEEEFPEEAQILAELCAERAEAKEQGKKIQPIFLTDEFLESDLPLIITPRRVDNKIGRNDPCPCGSGKKFKKCCIMKI